MARTTWTHRQTERECEVEYRIHGRHIRATRLDPEEFPEVEIISVTVEGTNEDITSEVDENEHLIETCQLDAQERAVEDAYEAAERRGDEMRDR